MSLSPAAKQLLLALGSGATLKSHRDLDGNKQYRLHPLHGEASHSVEWQTVEQLREQQLIDSNKKFPAATYLLTDKGKALVTTWGKDKDDLPLTARGWRE
ncbi:MAG TPA: hypothetical protein VK879_05320 [Candidatus Sulfomarinibacteraceae bacterium]|nr:hypothetical protein [Candidatus Sulfomarinibacteraceae bacterium]